MIELRAVRADGFNEVDLDRCWADSEMQADTGACQAKPTDALGLCPFHRAKLFGDVTLPVVLPGPLPGDGP